MVGVCCGVRPDEQVDFGSLELSRVDVGSCEESRRTMRTWEPNPVEGCWLPQVHRPCAHNEVEALKLRLFGSTLPPEVFQDVSDEIKRVVTSVCRLSRSYNEGVWSLEQTARSYTGLLARRYEEAWHSLEDVAFESKDARVKAFLKAEKVNVGPKWAKPRMICPRSPRYNLLLASRLKPFEHWLWGRLGARLTRGGTGRLVAKGLNPRRRANLIVRKFGNFGGDCVVFEADGKAFEAHVGRSQLEQEQRVYRAAFPGDQVLNRLLSYQLDLRGRLACGGKFERPGGRASGDFNTGMGNTIIMLCVVVAVMRSLGVKFDVLVDGDNCLVFLERSSLPLVMANFAVRSQAWSGQELVVERPVDVLEEIRFGQSAPVNLGGKLGWTMVRDFKKVLSTSTSSYRWLREPSFAVVYLQGVARCELSLSRGVPVLQAWALHILGQTHTRKKLKEHPFLDYFVVGAWFAGEADVVEVSGEARLSFERAFGLSVEDQLAMESSFDYRAGQDYLRREGFRTWQDAEPGLTENWYEART
jgi:hypothetical protein